MTQKITCLNLKCPERKSICCGHSSIFNSKDFVCSWCGKEFVGGKCVADLKMIQNNQDIYKDLMGLFDEGCNTDNISDPPSDKRWIKSFIKTHTLPKDYVRECMLDLRIKSEEIKGEDRLFYNQALANLKQKLNL